MNSAERKQKSREARAEDKKTQDREVNAKVQKEIRARQGDEKKTQRREVDAKAHKERRAGQDDEKKTQDREVDAKAHKDKRGTNYADHRLHIETSLRRHQRLPPTNTGQCER